MAHAGVNRLCMPCSRAVAAAVVWRAEVRAPLDDLARNAGGCVARVVTADLRPPTRVLRDAASLGRVRSMPSGVPVRGPLPYIADHVAEAVTVGWKCADRGGAAVAVGGQVFVGESALPRIRHVTAAGREFIAPGELGAVKAS